MVKEILYHHLIGMNRGRITQPWFKFERCDAFEGTEFIYCIEHGRIQEVKIIIEWINQFISLFQFIESFPVHVFVPDIFKI